MKKIEHSINAYLKNKISFGKATELAGLTYWEFLEELRSRHIPLPLSPNDPEIEINKIEKGAYDKFIPKKK